ncbi:Pyruvate dehydrogenase complex protein X component, mitochondrial [Cyphellophora attinorum]|uniref:Pyruvate dehydrogenase complex protein X component, mitochondrial n=1 Tax=Cyphellophora attinorum TaxID=1664694 RepID=A0A0N1P1A2_9EURO|nr:Pyruvate dehydrogenase complex protein X component, mitochondrial [Phialophora attinorum]KPI41765.1 Pyruvate dehydrogenase complex protein X component, mitochondrial [Phialophora attinorum]
MAGRQSARVLAQQLRSATSQPYAGRSFSSIPTRLAAHSFTMPAMSPTMTEGNIASWKVKEGDSFSTGDVLLEIETDKATIDVEAQDDGVMAKIFAQDGEKGVKVGTRIAVLAEEGDDISSLEMPAEESKPAPKAEESKESAPSEPSPPKQESQLKKQPQKSSSPPPSGPGQNPKYPLYPSVQALLHANHIPEADIPKIRATGPQNRLLKGDVLAYLGTISSDYPSEQSKRLTNLAHLDLSNIKPLPQKPKSAKPTDSSLAASAQELPPTTQISLPISLSTLLATQRRLSETLGTNIPLTTFLARAVDLANDDLPLPKPTNRDLLAANQRVAGECYEFREVCAFSIENSVQEAGYHRHPHLEIHEFKIFAGETAAPIGGSISTTGGAMNIFSVTVPAGEEKRARTFLERVKTVLQVEPGRLVL